MAARVDDAMSKQPPKMFFNMFGPGPLGFRDADNKPMDGGSRMPTKKRPKQRRKKCTWCCELKPRTAFYRKRDIVCKLCAKLIASVARVFPAKTQFEHDGYPARYVGTHKGVGVHKGCRLGERTPVLWVSAPHPYYVCGCDKRLTGAEVIFDSRYDTDTRKS